MKFLVAGTMLWIAWFGMVSAHGDGASFEQKVGEYLIDVGYDPAVPTAGTRMLFDLALSREGTLVPYDSAWVRVFSGNRTFFATGVSRAALGPTTMLITVPDTLTLEVSVRFEKGGVSLAESSFPLSVSPAPTEGQSTLYVVVAIVGVLSLLTGATGAYFLCRHV